MAVQWTVLFIWLHCNKNPQELLPFLLVNREIRQVFFKCKKLLILRNQHEMNHIIIQSLPYCFIIQSGTKSILPAFPSLINCHVIVQCAFYYTYIINVYVHITYVTSWFFITGCAPIKCTPCFSHLICPKLGPSRCKQNALTLPWRDQIAWLTPHTRYILWATYLKTYHGMYTNYWTRIG